MPSFSRRFCSSKFASWMASSTECTFARRSEGRQRPVSRESGVSAFCWKRSHISSAYGRWGALGAYWRQKRCRLSTSRRRSFRALAFCAMSTDCGKSMMTGPSAPTSTLKSERSPCTTPAATIRTTSRMSRPYITSADSGSNARSATRGAGSPSASSTSSISSTPSTKCSGVGTRTPAACRRWIMSTSVDFHAASSCARPCLERLPIARWSRVLRTLRPSVYSARCLNERLCASL